PHEIKRCPHVGVGSTIACMATRNRALRAGDLAVAAPVIKWVGGKTKLLPELLARMPARFGRYYEPFAGGAALFFRITPAHAVVGDANADLISTYRALALDPGR